MLIRMDSIHIQISDISFKLLDKNSTYKNFAKEEHTTQYYVY